MKAIVAALARRGVHPAWLAAGVTFPVLLVSAGMRSMPGVLLVPSAEDLGGDRATISFAVSVGLAITGFMGPFTAALMQRFGVRKMIPAALILISLAVAATDQVTSAWQLVLSWGLLTGIGTGMLSNVLAAVVTGRWFQKSRGLALGLLTAGFQTGMLIFVPLLAYVSEHAGWRQASMVVAAVALAMVPVVLLLMPERPSTVGVPAYGGTSIDQDKPATGNPITAAFGALKIGVRVPTFWLLATGFFVCGLSTNGLVGTHLISLCEDHGLPELRGAALLATMGVFDLFGATLPVQTLWVWGVMAVMLATLYWFLKYTDVGRAVRACSINLQAARLMGVNAERMRLVVFAVSGAGGALAGIVVTPIVLASWDAGITYSLKGFVGAIVGGFRSPTQAVIAGLGIGLLEAFSAGYISSGWQDLIVYGVLLSYLLIKGGVFLAGRATLAAGQLER
jgi:branched-subunit amino acid ABC-type transport system permease component